MYLSTLRNQINNFSEGNIITIENYVPLFVVEEVLNKKIVEFNQEVENYKEYLTKLTGYSIKINMYSHLIVIEYNTGLFSNSNRVSVDITNSEKIRVYKDFGDKNKKVVKLLEKDEETKNFILRTLPFRKFSSFMHLDLKTNLGLFVNFNLEDRKTLKILVSDKKYNTKYANSFISRKLPSIFYKCNSFYAVGFMVNSPQKIEEDELNFYYYKDSNGEKKIHYENEEVKELINEELLGKMYLNMCIPISSFDEELQEEIKQFYISRKLELKEKQEEEMKLFRSMQIDRIMKAYNLIKEAIELLNNSKTDITFDKIKIENLSSILFKYDGKPNSRGFIEFEDLFKNNMILRMLDLSMLSLDNVDIRGIDFSYTNIHIDPQTIFNKDMSYVNASGVKFSPWSDIFDDVILNGTIIDDIEANVDLNKVKSYNSDTYIGKNVVQVLIREN